MCRELKQIFRRPPGPTPPVPAPPDSAPPAGSATPPEPPPPSLAMNAADGPASPEPETDYESSHYSDEGAELLSIECAHV